MHTTPDIMSGAVTGAAFAAELLEHILAVRYAVTALTLGKLTMVRMAEGASQF